MENVTFIPAEYILGNIMVAMYKIGVEKISVRELFEISSFVQQSANESNANIVILLDSSKINDLKLNFSEYFTINDEFDFVEINSERNIVDLQARFIGYIPFESLIFLIQQINEYIVLKNNTENNNINLLHFQKGKKKI